MFIILYTLYKNKLILVFLNYNTAADCESKIYTKCAVKFFANICIYFILSGIPAICFAYRLSWPVNHVRTIDSNASAQDFEI